MFLVFQKVLVSGAVFGKRRFKQMQLVERVAHPQGHAARGFYFQQGRLVSQQRDAVDRAFQRKVGFLVENVFIQGTRKSV